MITIRLDATTTELEARLAEIQAALAIATPEEEAANAKVRDVLAQQPLDRKTYNEMMDYHAVAASAVRFFWQLETRIEAELLERKIGK